ncbi:hypothetical protein CPB83DRAFT_840722 [Crepidotus variabilis]|uniref:Uncharacterized protein n=1 Tax=Crepidotus variabilis TaxID=179855 RepID=A0A9P6E411_9AGAR|nr:hypothetical protein CPB83DRAFT_840722 [Crepidotus variabilis]
MFSSLEFLELRFRHFGYESDETKQCACGWGNSAWHMDAATEETDHPPSSGRTLSAKGTESPTAFHSSKAKEDEDLLFQRDILNFRGSKRPTRPLGGASQSIACSLVCTFCHHRWLNKRRMITQATLETSLKVNNPGGYVALDVASRFLIISAATVGEMMIVMVSSRKQQPIVAQYPNSGRFISFHPELLGESGFRACYVSSLAPVWQGALRIFGGASYCAKPIATASQRKLSAVVSKRFPVTTHWARYEATKNRGPILTRGVVGIKFMVGIYAFPTELVAKIHEIKNFTLWA